MSPFSACTWAMAPRSRITLNTSYTCSERKTQLWSLLHKGSFQHNSWILIFTECQTEKVWQLQFDTGEKLFPHSGAKTNTDLCQNSFQVEWTHFNWVRQRLGLRLTLTRDEVASRQSQSQVFDTTCISIEPISATVQYSVTMPHSLQVPSRSKIFDIYRTII